MPGALRFPFRFDPRFVWLARPFGVRPENAWVEVTDELLKARFGPWRVTTPLANVVAVEVTGPYRLWRTAGPARLGVSDLGLTFAGNPARGVRIAFASRVRGIDRGGRIRHGELTVTVADVDGLAAALRERAGLA